MHPKSSDAQCLVLAGLLAARLTLPLGLGPGQHHQDLFFVGVSSSCARLARCACAVCLCVWCHLTTPNAFLLLPVMLYQNACVPSSSSSHLTPYPKPGGVREGGPGQAGGGLLLHPRGGRGALSSAVVYLYHTVGVWVSEGVGASVCDGWMAITSLSSPLPIHPTPPRATHTHPPGRRRRRRRRRLRSRAGEVQAVPHRRRGRGALRDARLLRQVGFVVCVPCVSCRCISKIGTHTQPLLHVLHPPPPPHTHTHTNSLDFSSTDGEAGKDGLAVTLLPPPEAWPAPIDQSINQSIKRAGNMEC